MKLFRLTPEGRALIRHLERLAAKPIGVCR